MRIELAVDDDGSRRIHRCSFHRAVLSAFVILPIFYAFGCRSPVEIVSTEYPTIRYWMSGGYEGGTYRVLAILPDGTARNEEGYPVIEKQLSRREHENVVSLFEGFHNFPDSSMFTRSGCKDDMYQHLEVAAETWRKYIVVSGCAEVHDTVRAKVERFRSIMNTLFALADSIYTQNAPWIGVTVDFRTDKLVYSPDDPIILKFIINNPTARARTLHFEHQQQYFFAVSRNNPYVHYPYPPYNYRDTTQPSSIALESGERKELVHALNLKEALGTTVVPGTYGVWMKLLVGRYQNDYQTPSPIEFEVVDSSLRRQASAAW